MTDYTKRLVLAIPTGLVKQGNFLARSIDYDEGGDLTFGGLMAGPDVNTPTLYVADILLTEAIVSNWSGKSAMVMASQLLSDSSSRWAQKEQPVLSVVRTALSQVVFKVLDRDGPSLEDALKTLGLVLIPPIDPHPWKAQSAK